MEAYPTEKEIEANYSPLAIPAASQSNIISNPTGSTMKGQTFQSNNFSLGVAGSVAQVGWKLDANGEVQIAKKITSGTTSFSSTTTLAVTTGWRPTQVRIHATTPAGTNRTVPVFSNGGWDEDGGNNCVWQGIDTPGADTNGTAGVTAKAWDIQSDTDGGSYHQGIVTSITDTGFTLSNTKTGTPSTVYIYYQCEG